MTVRSWFLTVTTFALGYFLGRYDYQFETLLYWLVSTITGQSGAAC